MVVCRGGTTVHGDESRSETVEDFPRTLIKNRRKRSIHFNFIASKTSDATPTISRSESYPDEREHLIMGMRSSPQQSLFVGD